MSHLFQKLADARVHDLLCQHPCLVQLPNELDVAQRTPPPLHYDPTAQDAWHSMAVGKPRNNTCLFEIYKGDACRLANPT